MAAAADAFWPSSTVYLVGRTGSARDQVPFREYRTVEEAEKHAAWCRLVKVMVPDSAHDDEDDVEYVVVEAVRTYRVVETADAQVPGQHGKKART